MKRVLLIWSMLFCLFCTGTAQPANEINCFQNFQYDFVGNSRVNAYLLSLLAHYVYPPNLLNTDNDDDPRVKHLHDDPVAFLSAFQQKVGHYFFNPNAIIVGSSAPTTTLNTTLLKPAVPVNNKVNLDLPSNHPAAFSFVNYNGGNGYDPEAAIISTDKYIIVVFRGTDRVSTNVQTPGIGDLQNAIIYNLAEWITTDANAVKMTPLEGIPGKVHAGFNTSLNFIKQNLEDTLKRYGAATKKIWITGHSLGSAQAQLFGVYLKKKFPSWDLKGVYVYAAPHVGDAEFVSHMNEILPGALLQRFDFMDDPITNLPAYFMGFQRAGLRNLYTKEQGSNYNYNTAEARTDIGAFYFCLHHTQWYCRAAFFELLDHQPELQGKIPNAPSRPTSFCTQLDLARVTGSSNLLTAGGTDLPEGTYTLRLATGAKYLNAPSETDDQNGTLLQMHDIGNSPKNMQWIVKKVPNAIIESYTIQCADKLKYIDADFLNTDNNGCKIQLWDRGLNGFRTNQEWKVIRLNSGTYQIINVKSDSKALDVLDNCVAQNGCKLQLTNKNGNDATQQWFFVRVQ